VKIRRAKKTKAELPPIQRLGGGYSAGEKPIAELKPPKGPAAGAKPTRPNGKAETS